MGVVAQAIRYLDLMLAPAICPGCQENLCQDQEDGRLCRSCDQELSRLPENRCGLCGAPLNTSLELCQECTDTDRPWCAGTAAFPYDGTVGDWIRAFKYGAHTEYLNFFVREMARAWRKYHGNAIPDAVTPIPLHWFRERTRGFNQAALLAEGLAKELHLEYLPVLRRAHATAHQARLGEKNRARNLRHAFVVKDASAIVDKTILVVDDVFTTGATLTAACQALLDAGAEETAILTVARA